MMEEKDIFEIKDSTENFDTWLSKGFVPDDIKNTLKEASILLIPTLGFRDSDELLLS